jgi:hypothetical protein
MQNGITMLNELPNNTINYQSTPIPSYNQNINITKNEIISENNNSIKNPNINNLNLESNIKQYNEMIGQLQKATVNGIIELPTRDIPINVNSITHDDNCKPDFIPKELNNNYINNIETTTNLIDKHNKILRSNDNLDILYGEMQNPIIIILLYFIFTMPFFNLTLIRYFPKIFKRDGNPSLYGNIIISVIFGLSFYCIIKMLNYIEINN